MPCAQKILSLQHELLETAHLDYNCRAVCSARRGERLVSFDDSRTLHSLLENEVSELILNQSHIS
jgi:hypothetical protein